MACVRCDEGSMDASLPDTKQAHPSFRTEIAGALIARLIDVEAHKNRTELQVHLRSLLAERSKSQFQQTSSDDG